jgi:hypothetical protein
VFARNVPMRRVPNGLAEFTRTMDQGILALLRRQQTFPDENMFVASGGLEAIS